MRNTSRPYSLSHMLLHWSRVISFSLFAVKWYCVLVSLTVFTFLYSSPWITIVPFINYNRMEAVYAWCKGAKFIEVQKLTGSFEGTTIRTLRRLEELIRQIASATKAIGNHELMTKFETAGELLKRDIVFCSSLYL